MGEPSGPPPSYDQAMAADPGGGFLHPGHNGTTTGERRSADDDRPLPIGWVRKHDPQYGHPYYIDLISKPPRSTWSHPHDDEQYLRSLDPEERARIQRSPRAPSRDGYTTNDAGEGRERRAPYPHSPTRTSGTASPRPWSPAPPPAPVGSTGGSRPPSTHSQRDSDRRGREKFPGPAQEDRATERQRRQERDEQTRREQQVFRQAVDNAVQTGRPQLLGPDENGREVYIEAPSNNYNGVVGTNRISQFSQEVFYANGQAPGPPGARFIRPDGPYPSDAYGAYGRPFEPQARPHGRGSGGSRRNRAATPLIGGALLGSLVLGSLGLGGFGL